MIKFGKAFISTMVLATAIFAGANDAKAENAVLIKVSNVNPIKTVEGVITACDFELTFYNRSEINVSSATLDLSWTDKAAKSLIDEEKSGVNTAPRRMVAAGESVTEKTNPADLVYSVSVPSLTPHQQVSMKANVATDRCFLLIDEPIVTAPKCSAGNNVNCSGMFKAVSSKDPQYYREFKKVSIEDQKKIEKSRQEQLKEELNSEYNKVVSSMEEATRVLTTIK